MSRNWQSSRHYWRDENQGVIGHPDIEEAEEVVVKAAVFGSELVSSGQSRAIREDRLKRSIDKDVIAPPINLFLWASMLDINTRLKKAVDIMARNTVGLGWEIVPIDQVLLDLVLEGENQSAFLDDGTMRPEVREEQMRLNQFFLKPNSEMPFTELMYLIKTDEEATGNGYMEMVRNNDGTIASAWHIEAHTMFIRRGNLEGFVQKKGRKKRFFKKFGDDRPISVETGQLVPGLTPDDPEAASEIIHFRLYSPRSAFYGMPRFIPAAASITGNSLAAKRNVVFFENDAVGRMAVVVEGGKLDAESVTVLRDFMGREGKGVDHAHRVIILQADPQKAGAIGPAGKTKINLIPLTVGVTEDASFGQYRTDNNEEVRECFGIAEVFFKTQDTNRASSMIGRQITNECTFAPDRLNKEFILNQTLLGPQGLKAQFTCLRFKVPQPADAKEMAIMDTMLANAGALTPNDLRMRIGLPPFPNTPEFAFAKKPIKIALAELQQQTVLARQATADRNRGRQNDDENDNDDNNDEDGGSGEGKELGAASVDRRGEPLVKSGANGKGSG